jgi:hypothetical protein
VCKKKKKERAKKAKSVIGSRKKSRAKRSKKGIPISHVLKPYL